MAWLIGNLVAVAAAWVLSVVMRRRRRAQQLEMLADEPIIPTQDETEVAVDEQEPDAVAPVIPTQRRTSPDVSAEPDDGVRTRAWRG